MDFAALKTLATSKAARGLLQTKKHSPQILFVTGAVGFVATTVLAAKATLGLHPLLDQADKDKQKLAAQLSGKFQTSPITQDAHDEALRKVRMDLGKKVIRAYLPALGVGLVSIGALTGSHIILTKRNGMLGAAYLALDLAHRQYRQNVVTEFGPETDRKLATEFEKDIAEERLSDGTTVTKTVSGKARGNSPYTHIFDEDSKYFSKEPGRNLMTLQMKQSELNTKLLANGHVTLNEALKRLGLPTTPEGFQIGWVYKPRDENHKGDNFVDFGLGKGDEEQVEAFFDGHYYYAVLDFNCDPGFIYDNV